MKEELDKIILIYQAISKIQQFTEGMKSVDELISDLLVWDAVKLNLIVIYETYLKLALETKEKYNSVDWNKIEETSPNVMNLYFGFDSKYIWNLIWKEIPEFKKRMEEIL
jgi:uncharacterized protein with HEPN domain